MTTTSQFVNGVSIGDLLSYPSTLGFSAGQAVEDSSNQTSSSTVLQSHATEVEYNFQMTSSATGSRYCFRSTHGGLEFDNYDKVAELVMLHAPTIDNFSLNNAQNIILTEGATTTIYATSTVSDLNGYTDLSLATSTIYRSGVGVSCSQNDNSCYRTDSPSCTLSNCSGNSCLMACRADMQYFADPTDTGTPYVAENWLAQAYVRDSTGLTDAETSFGVELLSLYGLSIDTGGIDFGSLAPGQNTNTVNATTSIYNTGNRSINIDLSGTDLVGGASTIGVGQQKFATTTFAYGSCSICQFLTGSATTIDVDLPKVTSSSTPTSDDVYWGLNVPLGTAGVLHTGTNTFTATSDN